MTQPIATAPPVDRYPWTFWLGWAISLGPILMLGVGGVVCIVIPAVGQKELTRLGYPVQVVPAVVALEIASAVLYAIPPTAVLGAILLTAYLGGAVASHVRVGEGKWAVAVVVGIMVWLGLVLREARLRPMLPLRRRHRP